MPAILSAIDIAILGGGPAGTGCAISLRRNFPRWQVAVFEASDYSRPRPGEILPAAAMFLLRQLRVPADFLSDCGVTAESVASAWGGDDLIERHHLFSARGAGAHLDRNAFDCRLSEAAEAAGALVHRNLRFRSASRDDENEPWSVELSCGRSCKARFLVDATGRSASLARSQGARFHRFDRLTAYSRLFDEIPTSEDRTVVEACALGWWYTAPLPHARRVASLLTDIDLGREAGLPSSEAWERSLRRTSHIAPLLGEVVPHGRAAVTPASTSLLSAFGGPGWLATGDAAVSCDPLAGQGITSALRSGILASYAAADALLGKESTGLQRYEAMLQAQFAGFQRQHRAHHARELRWCDEPFWQRRLRTFDSFDSDRLIPVHGLVSK